MLKIKMFSFIIMFSVLGFQAKASIRIPAHTPIRAFDTSTDILMNKCERYAANDKFTKSIAVVAERMGYSFEELCYLPHLLDIYVQDTFVNINTKPVEHIWLTLHYSDYSCQYFLRHDNLSMTQKNCYNTW